jgi:hypothetical protein
MAQTPRLVSVRDGRLLSANNFHVLFARFWRHDQVADLPPFDRSLHGGLKRRMQFELCGPIDRAASS